MSERKNYSATIYNPKYKAIIKELIALRMGANLKQSDIAETLNITQPDISKIERYERRIDALELARWLKATNGSFDKIIKIVKI